MQRLWVAEQQNNILRYCIRTDFLAQLLLIRATAVVLNELMYE